VFGRVPFGTDVRGRTVAVPLVYHNWRVVDLDQETVTVLRAWRRERASMALQLGRDTALVFGDHEGRHRHPQRFSRLFAETIARCRRNLGGEEPGSGTAARRPRKPPVTGPAATMPAPDAPPANRLHDLRHTHATILLASRENVKVVSERLGHASVTVTLSIYAHVMPGNQRAAADRFAALIAEARP